MTKIKKHLQDMRESGKEILNAGCKAAYRAGSRIERSFTEKGKLSDDAKDLANRIAEGAKDLGRKTAQDLKEAHESIQAKGGYVEVVKDTGERLYEKSEELYDKFKDTFYDEKGHFDKEKAKDVLSDKTQATKRFGKRAVDDLTELAKSGAKAVEQDYRRHIPSKEERAGIGDEYKGVITRQHLEDCQGYETKIRSQLPGGLKVRRKIIEDIRAYAITSNKELNGLYETDDPEKSAVEKYFR